MKKNIKLIIVVVICFLVFPINIYAEIIGKADPYKGTVKGDGGSGSTEENYIDTTVTTSSSKTSTTTGGSTSMSKQDESGAISGTLNTASCSPNCKGVINNRSIAGMRISFVDANGNQVANVPSFNYFTLNEYGTKTHSLIANVADYSAKPQTAATFSAGTIDNHTLPGFGTFAEAFDKYAAQLGSPTRSGISANKNGMSGGCGLNAWSKESVFIASITSADNIYSAIDIEAFIMALYETSGKTFDKDALFKKIQEGCKEGVAIFFVSEPMITYMDSDHKSYTWTFGTVSDMALLPSASQINTPASRLSQFANSWYYPSFDPEPIYQSCSAVAPQGANFGSASDALSKANEGYGMHLNWATDSENGCVTCSFTSDGYFTYNNVIYKEGVPLPNRFSSISQYALTKRSQGGAGCCEILGATIKEKGGEWESAYKKYCEEIPEDTCPDEVKEPIKQDYNNCCDANTSEIEETKIEDLFCKETDGGICVDSFKKKKFSERYYKDEKALADNKFCDMYCTERIKVEIPGPITAKNGRYFKLTTTSQGSTGPYTEGYRRCRVRIEYDQWYNDYMNQVQAEITNYNQYQKDYAHFQMYTDASESEVLEDGDVVVKKNCHYTCMSAGTTGSLGDSVSSSYHYNYTCWGEYRDMNKYPEYLIDKKLVEYKSLDMVEKGVEYPSHKKWSCNGLKAAIEGREAAVDALTCPSKGANCSLDSEVKERGELPHENDSEYDENVPDKVIEYESKYEADNKAYKVATEKAQELEEKLDQCDYWFAEDVSKIKDSLEYVEGPYWGNVVMANGDGTSESPEHAKDNFDFQPEVSFTYSQVYLSDKGTLDDTVIGINFQRNCEYSIKAAVKGESTEDIYAEHYDNCKYKSGTMTMQDMQDKRDLIWDKQGQYFNVNPKHQDSGFAPYTASKKFTTDAVYEAKCQWNDDNNEVYTLSHSGLASEADEINTTIHGEEYQILLTTLDGTYETYWDVGRLGHKGRMDKYFEGSNSCAGESKEDSAIFTCKIHTTHTIIYTGTCEPVTTPSNKDSHCTIADSDYKLFNFKVAEDDPDEFFPSGTSTDEGEIAVNWYKESAGTNVISEMKTTANQDATYSKEHLSYVFNLDPQTMKKISNYNKYSEENNEGGYGDFNMLCSCPSGTISSVDANNQACVKCRSIFLTNLATNKMIVLNEGEGYSVPDVWQGKDIETVRAENYGW